MRATFTSSVDSPTSIRRLAFPCPSRSVAQVLLDVMEMDERARNDAEWPGSRQRITSLDVADAMLAASAHQMLRGIAMTNGATLSIIESLEPGKRRHLATLPASLGNAATARLAFLVGLDGTGERGGIGRLRLKFGTMDLEFMVDVTSSEGALSGVEVFRLSTPAMLVAESSRNWGASSMMAPYPYRIDGELGRGGMGVVYRAFHESLQRPVAIKVLQANRAQRAEDCFRFLREARAASRVRHPGVVEILDFGALNDGRGFMVMELVDAATLRAVLEQGPMNPSQAVRVLASIASAIEAAHGQGVIHRDLKPENVFVLPNDEVKVVDFGAAKLLMASPPGDTADDLVLGTPRYMAPEHAWGQPTDQRTDVYALGCILFEMLSGEPPYDGVHAAEIMMRHARDPIPEVRANHGEFAQACNPIIRKAMAKRPGDRYPTAKALEEALKQKLGEKRSWWQRWGIA